MALPQSQEKADYVAVMFGRIARRYDLLNTVMTAGRHHSWRRLATDLAVARLEGMGLDVATGTGDFALELARRPQVSGVVALDFSPQMLRVAEAKLRRKRLERRVEFILGDALALPFPDNTFAFVTSGFSLRNVADVGPAFSEMTRVAKPGGKVVTLEFTPVKGRDPFSRFFPWYFRNVTPRLGALLAADREAYSYLPSSVEGFSPAEEVASIMEKAGLKEVAFRKVALGTLAIHVGRK
ncbi:MAG: bifunctional demethylmenaquinone methyltransferase/2-methoxy-6-polyprenyl-1,4-benzoquinol methylase UbiE [Chloroflexi bacterium]|nr:bifunctional demethylmenaquinone methyltransferase/2-methoxy-6-polyprenyl-1,4-benzoquinol methylase UbiE [Chloroflexota bacterium]